MTLVADDFAIAPTRPYVDLTAVEFLTERVDRVSEWMAELLKVGADDLQSLQLCRVQLHENECFPELSGTDASWTGPTTAAESCG